MNDIEILEDFMEYAKNVIDDMEYKRPIDVTINKFEIKALKHAITALKERQADKDRIKELEDDLYCANNMISEILEGTIAKDAIREITAKAEVMDYYTLSDVIDDLNKLLGESND